VEVKPTSYKILEQPSIQMHTDMHIAHRYSHTLTQAVHEYRCTAIWLDGYIAI